MGSRSDHSDRDKAARITRLKNRAEQLGYREPQSREVLTLFKALLDLLADEL
jgi:hypothetical protein